MDQREDPTGDTFDYGLKPGESFEPDLIDDVDRTQDHIMTVLGPVEPGALGVSNPAARFVDPREDPAAVLRELEEVGFVGVNALVNLAPINTAQEAASARWLAGRCDLHLIVTTAPGETDAVGNVLPDHTIGIGGSDVFPGAVVTLLEPGMLRAASQASIATGLPLIVRIEHETTGFAIAQALEQENVIPADVIVTGNLTDPEPLLDAGSTLLLELNSRDEASTVASLIAELVEQEWADQILVGFNPQPGHESVSFGEASRWSWLIEQFPLLLLDAGLDAMTVRNLMIENPNRALTIHPPATSASYEESS